MINVLDLEKKISVIVYHDTKMFKIRLVQFGFNYVISQKGIIHYYDIFNRTEIIE